MQTLTWARRGAYQDDTDTDGWIYGAAFPTPTVITCGPALVNDFAAVLDRRRLIAFYERYGLLGQKAAGARPPKAFLDGDSTLWALDHAENVRLIRQFASRSARTQAEGLARLDKRRLAWGDGADGVLVPLARPDVQGKTLKWYRRVWPGDPRHAGQLAAVLLNANLTGVVRVYDPVRRESTFQLKTLIDAVYWSLADSLGQLPIRRCRCGALFFQTRRGQQFCPPVPGRKDSACAKRFRMRRLRKEQR